VREEIDMLQGNINRMCVTREEKELERMRDWAKRRIDKIYDIRKEELQKK